MKFFARLHVIVLLAISAVLYMAWSLRSYHPITRAKKVWSRTTTQIVVFGDSWSTNRLEPPETAHQPAPSDRLWVDVLCSEIVCDHVYDFAQSLPSDPVHRRGPVLDNEIYGNVTKTLNLTTGSENIADFRHQVDEFLSQDVGLKDGEEKKGQTMTIFTVFFGIWEIWDFVSLDESAVMRAMLECIGSMFAQLDRIVAAKSVSSIRPTVIIPRVPDPTWFPRWMAQRTGPNGSDVHGQLQRQAIILTELWNKVLERQADNWGKADIVMPDFNQWILDQMRKPEIEETGLAAIWKVRGGARFTELTQPCVNSTTSLGQDARETQPLSICEEPSRYLFWDDTRLTGAAHALLGKHVADVLKNSTFAN